jgi:hypothetical protein
VAGTIIKATVDSGDLGYLQFLGRTGTATTNSFAGRADEWRISNVVLTPAQFLNAP